MDLLPGLCYDIVAQEVNVNVPVDAKVKHLLYSITMRVAAVCCIVMGMFIVSKLITE